MPNRSFYGTACKAFSPGCRDSSQIARKHPLMELPRRFEKGGVFRKVQQKVELSSCQFDMVYLAAIIQRRSERIERSCDRYETISSNKHGIGKFMTTAVAVGTMKAAQVTAAGAGLRIVELEIPQPRSGTGAHQSSGMRCVPQRCDHPRRAPARNLLSPSSRA